MSERDMPWDALAGWVSTEGGRGVRKTPMRYVIAPLSVDESEIWVSVAEDEDGRRWVGIKRQDTAGALTLSLAQAPWLVKALAAIVEDEG